MSKKRKSRKKITKRKTSSVDLAVVGTIILSILALVLVYTEAGYIGIMVSEFLGGMFGWLKYILPIGTILISINIACKNNEYLTGKLVQYGILLICISVILSVHQISVGSLDMNKELSEIMKDAYYNGSNDIGGGALGTLAAVPLVKLFGKLGTIILSLGTSIMLFIITFGIDITSLLNNILDNIIQKREDKREKKEYQKQQYIKEQQKINKQQEKIYKQQEKIRAREEAKRMAQAAKQAKMQNKLNRNHEVENILNDPDEIMGNAQMENIQKQNNNNQTDLNQLHINLNGQTFDEKGNEIQKTYKHNKDDIEIINKKEKMQPDYIESNLFKQEEEKKEEKIKQVLQLEHAMSVEDEAYEYPPVEILSPGESKELKGGAKALTETAAKLQKTLYSFGVSAKVENVSVGPAITRYELKPAEGVRESKISGLADDIALNLAAETIRIEAPIPGKQAVGIEVPNKVKEMVHLREVIESEDFQKNKSKLSVALGKDIAGKAIIADIAKMPHALIAGSTGSGKSVCINTIITSIIYNAKPNEVKLVMIDPKVVELSVYNGIPHLLIPVVTDPKKAAGALAWAVQEMDNRYNLFAEKGVRDLKGYNAAVEKANQAIEEQENTEDGEEKKAKVGKLPQIVIIIDELADLMMVAAKEVEDAICRLAQKARAAGMHLVIATQRPSVDVITGIIKANVPSRIAFAVMSQVDSRTILDSVGAEKLLGKGDMLFYPSGAPKPTRVQGAYVSDEEVEKIVSFVKSNGTAKYSQEIIQSIENGNKNEKTLEAEQADDDGTDQLLDKAIEEVVTSGQASTSFIQRKLKVGYSRAGRIIDQLEERGIIESYQGNKPRQVLMTLERLNELKQNNKKDTQEV